MPAWSRLAVYFVLAFLLSLGILRYVPKQNQDLPPHPTLTEPPSQDLKIIDWALLRELDLQSGQATANLKAVDQKEVRIAGFMVPLDDYQSKVTEFLLVPSPQACIHVPPPPPNQMLYVKMINKAETPVAYSAIWVQGVLRLTKVESPYGSVSYEMEGKFIKPYVFDRPSHL